MPDDDYMGGMPSMDTGPTPTDFPERPLTEPVGPPGMAPGRPGMVEQFLDELFKNQLSTPEAPVQRVPGPSGTGRPDLGPIPLPAPRPDTAPMRPPIPLPQPRPLVVPTIEDIIQQFPPPRMQDTLPKEDVTKNYQMRPENFRMPEINPHSLDNRAMILDENALNAQRFLRYRMQQMDEADKANQLAQQVIQFGMKRKFR